MTELESMLEYLTEWGVNDRLDTVLLKDEEYRMISERINKYSQEYRKVDLNEEQQEIIEGLLESYHESSARYGHLAYRQGVLDCVQLLKEMKVLPKI